MQKRRNFSRSFSVLNFAFLIFNSTVALSQGKFTLTGYVKDSSSSETIIGATISINGHGKGVNSNQFGLYSITLPAGEYEVTVSHVGFYIQKSTISLKENSTKDFLLISRATTYSEVIVSSRRRDANVEN